MGNSNSDESNSVDFYDFGKREEEFAARFLSRALDELGLANSNVSDCDLQVFAGTLIREMGLLIGSEEFLRERFGVCAQIAFIEEKHFARLREKIVQALAQRTAADGPDSFGSIF